MLIYRLRSRPEYVQLKNRPGENTFLSTIDRVVEGVTATDYYFYVNTNETSPHHIMVTLSRSDSDVIRAGQSSYLYLPAERAVIIRD